MYLDKLWLENFRNYESAELALAPDGITVVMGNNGQGKTNLIEAVGYLATLRSFRGANPEAMIRAGFERAIVRGEGNRDGRALLIETELARVGRGRALINKQPLKKAKDLAENLLSTVFSPDDLALVKDGPAERRRYLDDLLADGHVRMEALQHDVDRVLKQRNTLLRQSGGRLSAEVATTLDVWDSKFSELGEALGDAREKLVADLMPLVAEAYNSLGSEKGSSESVEMRLVTDWRQSDNGPGLAEALARNRQHDLQRGVTTVGPHRDELYLAINDMPARTQASQGEQRTLSLSLRLAGHRLLTNLVGVPPILLLDDVLSELDADRARRLLSELPAGQTLLTTATGTLPGTKTEQLVVIDHGTVR